MPNYGTYAICPYFSTEDPTAIKCEGIVQLNQVDTVYLMRFKNKDLKKEWLKKYCETHQWCKCPYAAMLEAKYDGKTPSVSPIVRETITADMRYPVKVHKSKDIKGQLTFSFVKEKHNEDNRGKIKVGSGNY